MPSDRMIVVAPGEGVGSQTHLREETAESELGRPVRQWRVLLVLRLLLEGAYAGLFLFWSPWSFLILGLAVIGLLVLRIDKDGNCKWRGGNDTAAQLVRILVVPCLLVAWFILWDDVLELAWPVSLDLILLSLPLRGLWRLHIFWRLIVTAILGAYIWSYPDLAYRMRAEVTDPSYPAPIAARSPDTGPAFPGAEIRSAGAEPAETVIREPYPVPRPIPTQSGNDKMLPPEPVYDSGYKSVIAPSGREISLNDLTTFIRQAVKTKIGTSSHAWKDRRGWQHERWQDAVDTWAVFGVMGEREDRRKPKMLVEDFTEAMGLLSTWLDTVPTPPEA